MQKSDILREIVKIDTQKSLMDALRSDFSKIAMDIYAAEREISDNFLIPATSLYDNYKLAGKVYNCSIIKSNIDIALADRYAQVRRAISELMRWYHGTLK